MAIISKTLNNNKNILYGFLIICAINCIVFSPALFQAPRGSDHYHYLVETSHIETLSDRLVASYSYPRTRNLGKGDEILFRPLFYILLSAETWLFNYDSFYWQLIALLLHMLVLWQIIKILRLVAKETFWLLGVLCFSLLYISQEMVTWHHISGYMLFLIFFLQAVFNLLHYYTSPVREEKHLVFMVLFFTLACFTFEISLVYILVLFFVLLHHFMKEERQSPLKPLVKVFGLIKERKLFAFFIPAVSYCLASASDYLVTMSGRADSEIRFFGITSPSSAITGLMQKFWNILYLGIGGTLFPCFARMYPYSKTRFDGFSFSPGIAAPKMLQMANILFILFLIGILVLKVFLSLSRNNKPEDHQRHSRASLVSRLAAVLFLSHIALLTAGRSQTHDYITFSLYHYYFLGVFALLSFSGWIGRFDEKLKQNKTISGNLIILSLCLFALLQGYQTCQFNLTRKRMDGAWNRYIRDVGRFVARHRQEEHFSFKISFSQRRKSIGIYEGNPETGTKHTGFFVDFLFREYIDLNNPHYYLVFTDQDGLLVFKNQPAALEHLKNKGQFLTALPPVNF